MEILPDPPARFSVDEMVRVCAKGTRLVRIYFRKGKYPSLWNEFRRFGPTSSRSDHHTEPRRAQTRGILYATTGDNGILTALAEVFQNTRLIDRARDEPWLTVFQLDAAVKLLDTSGEWPVRAGGNMAINSGSCERARAWSRVIYDSYPSVDGIGYPSSITNHECVALYERAAHALPSRTIFNEALASPKLTAGLLELAARLNYALA
jgi:hypothetical protein